MTHSLTWLADTLRSAGLKVVEQPGWEARGRGDMGEVKGVLIHHTAGAKTGNAPSLDIILNGRPDLPGPLSQLLLARDGTFHVLAAGKCNHAGPGQWQGVAHGNSSFIGIEAENQGTGADPWPQVQMYAYAEGVAAILKHIGADAVMAVGHKEYARPRGRKVDPSFDMLEFRASVESVMGGNAVKAVAPTDPVRSMLRKGDMGASVKALQTALGISADGNFGPATESAVKLFQSAKSLTPDGVVGPKTWLALGVK